LHNDTQARNSPDEKLESWSHQNSEGTGSCNLGQSETLPARSRIGEFEIVGIIGEGGFGTVYLAHDHSLQRQVALKEYRLRRSPRATASRLSYVRRITPKHSHPGSTVSSPKRGPLRASTIARWFACFACGRRTAPRTWRWRCAKGRPLTKVVKEQPELVNEAWLKAILIPLPGGVETLHAERIYHRDIAPTT
jgi:serine/threonine protein kinase